MNGAPLWCQKYVGLPFLDGGRTTRGIDCWGLVRLVFAEEKGIELPTYGDVSASDLRAIAEAIEAEIEKHETWLPAHPALPQPFDVVIMKRREKPVHIGVLVTESKMLHVEEATAAIIVDLDGRTIKQRVSKILRHRSFA